MRLSELKPDEAALRTIGKYEVLGTLGRGSMGVVYRARDPEIGRVVAIKTLRQIQSAHFHDAEAALERFRNEARSAGNLRHPNIITIFEVSFDQDTPFLVMDYVEGEGLDSIIAQHGAIDPKLTIQYLIQIAAALDYAHPKGVIHRDIKPSNLLIDKGGNVFVLDFGVATMHASFAGDDPAAPGGPVVGTPGYMSPEQILNQKLDYRSDLFSFAVVAFECFTGKRPFPGDTFTTVVGNILNGKPLSLTELNPHLPLALESEFERSLLRNKDERFQSAMSMVEALCKALNIDFSQARSMASGNLLPAVTSRKRKSTGWRSYKPEEATGAKPKPRRVRVPTLERLNPWRESAPTVESLEYPKSQDLSSAGGLFSHVEESITARRSLFIRPNSPLIRKLTLISAGVCLVLGIFLTVLLISKAGTGELGGNAANLEAPQGAAVGGASSAGPVARVDALSIPPVEAVPANKDVQEMNDQELLAVIMDRGAAEATTIKALQAARERRLHRIVEAIAIPLRSDSYLVRIEAIRLAAEIGDKQIVPALVMSLDDYDPLVRGHAAKALGQLGDRRALGYLTARYLKEEIPEIKVALKRAIEKINGFPMRE